MLSSKISHTADLQHILLLLLSSVACCGFDDADDVDATVDRDWPDEDLDATPVHLGDPDGVVSVLDTDAGAAAVLAGSTSTTRNTALPSRTLRTLSASQSPRDDDVEDEEWEGDPVKASQNALPNLRKRVWLAMAANIACCCSFWDDDSEEELAEEEGSETPVLGGSKGEVGGVGYAENDEIDEEIE